MTVMREAVVATEDKRFLEHRGIDPTGMRILRRFTLVLMVEGKGYYRDARGTKLEIGPGDVVLVESPSYVGALGVFRSYECRVVHVAMDDQGLSAVALTEAGRRYFEQINPAFSQIRRATRARV